MNFFFQRMQLIDVLLVACSIYFLLYVVFSINHITYGYKCNYMFNLANVNNNNKLIFLKNLNSKWLSFLGHNFIIK